MIMSAQTSAPTRDNAGVIAPPPLIALATILIGLVLDLFVPLFVLGNNFTWTKRLLLGGALIAAGAVLVLLANRRFEEAGTNVPPWKPALALATGGIYQHLRNPMYVGGCLAIAGVGFALGSEWTLILLPLAAWVLHTGVVLREEKYLEAKFGDDYRRYKASVPRYGWRL
jgi:protein-S-isoprenylcysteine O-methyltransferase Ste14